MKNQYKDNKEILRDRTLADLLKIVDNVRAEMGSRFRSISDTPEPMITLGRAAELLKTTVPDIMERLSGDQNLREVFSDISPEERVSKRYLLGKFGYIEDYEYDF